MKWIAGLLVLVAGIALAGSVGGPISPDGKPIQIDLPEARHQKNTGGSDGAGLCVFCSMKHTGDWQGNEVFYGLFEWMKRRPGGGYPDKVNAMLKAYCAEKGLTMPEYVQIEDNDLDVLRLACANGYMPCVTYSYSPTGRYGGQRISHMVNIANATNSFAVLDNNYPGAYEWLSADEFLKTYSGGRQGWCIILLEKAPPKAPRNK